MVTSPTPIVSLYTFPVIISGMGIFILVQIYLESQAFFLSVSLSLSFEKTGLGQRRKWNNTERIFGKTEHHMNK